MVAEPASHESTLEATATGEHGSRAASLHPRLVLALQADRPQSSSACYGLRGIHTVRFGRGRERAASRVRGVLTVTVPDRWMSSKHAELRLLLGRWRLSDSGSRNGCHVDGLRVDARELSGGELIELGHTLFFLQRECPDADDVDLAAREPELPGLTTFHPGLARELLRVRKLAQKPIALLLHGESGTGKEILARAIHHLSARSGPFVGVNTAALPESLLESELFGHKKGAFSGASSDRPGLIRSADRGTLFLDELGEMPLAAQAVLLRVLQEREVRPVGDTRAYPVDLRLISATNKPLAAKVESQEFRHDLYARVAGARVSLPPLRERRVDLGLLVAALLPRVASNADEVSFSIEAARSMALHHWPLNIRELENCLLAATAVADERVELEHLSFADVPVDAVTPTPSRAPVTVTKEQVERGLLEHGNNIAHTAKALGLSRQALYRRMQRFGIPRPPRANRP